MILGIQQDLKSEGIKVTISQLCRWFEVPRRTAYYKPCKAPPKANSSLGNSTDTHQQGSCFCPVDFSVSIEQLFG
jgi:hypothetical protein